MLRAHNTAASDMIEFAVPHTLAFTFFRLWLSGLRRVRPHQDPADRAQPASTMPCCRLVEGNCDLLISYHHARSPSSSDADRYDATLSQKCWPPTSNPTSTASPQRTACPRRESSAYRASWDTPWLVPVWGGVVDLTPRSGTAPARCPLPDRV